jgi:hypothetical protein
MKNKLFFASICAAAVTILILRACTGYSSEPVAEPAASESKTASIAIPKAQPIIAAQTVATPASAAPVLVADAVSVTKKTVTAEKIINTQATAIQVDVESTRTEVIIKKEIASATRTIKIENMISEKDKKYKYLMIHYSPVEFTLMANNNPINENADITITDNMLDLAYYARFQNGRETSKKYIYRLKPEVNTIAVSFDWHNDPRVKIDTDGAQFISESVIK